MSYAFSVFITETPAQMGAQHAHVEGTTEKNDAQLFLHSLIQATLSLFSHNAPAQVGAQHAHVQSDGQDIRPVVSL